MNQTSYKTFSVRQRLKSFVFALAGVKYFFINEHNAWIHGVAAAVTIIAGILMKLSSIEFIAVIISIALVLIAEMFNSAIEKIMDHLSPAFHPEVKIIKDLAAAAVLIAALIALIIGFIIFIPKFL